MSQLRLPVRTAARIGMNKQYRQAAGAAVAHIELANWPANRRHEVVLWSLVLLFSKLGDMQGLADHQAARQHEQQRQWMQLPGADAVDAAVELVPNAPLRRRESQHAGQQHARGNRCAFEV